MPINVKMGSMLFRLPVLRTEGVLAMKALANAYFIIGTAYAGKSTMIRLLAEKYEGILCEENYQDRFFPDLNKDEYPCLCYTRDLDDWHEFIRRTPEEYAAWIDGVAKECETLELL